MLIRVLFKFPPFQYHHTLQMTISVIGRLVGWLGFFVFMFHYNNQTTAIWALASDCMEVTMLLLRVIGAEDISSTTKTNTFYKVLLVDGV